MAVGEINKQENKIKRYVREERGLEDLSHITTTAPSSSARPLSTFLTQMK
jgi:hypothetical protein